MGIFIWLLLLEIHGFPYKSEIFNKFSFSLVEIMVRMEEKVLRKFNGISPCASFSPFVFVSCLHCLDVL